MYNTMQYNHNTITIQLQYKYYVIHDQYNVNTIQYNIITTTNTCSYVQYNYDHSTTQHNYNTATIQVLRNTWSIQCQYNTI